MQRLPLAAAASVAFLSTTGVVIGSLLLALESTSNLSLKASAVATAVLESSVLMMLCWFTSTLFLPKMKELSRPYSSIAFGLGATAGVIAFAASALTLAWLGRASAQDAPVQMNRHDFIIGTSVLLAIALVSQIVFMVIHFRSTRPVVAGSVPNFLSKDLGAWSPSSYVKSIRYSQTLPRTSDSEDMSSIQLQDSPSSMRSKFNVPGALKVTIPHAIRATSSRTRLLPTKETRRPLSLDSYTYPGSVQESFDNWDTSSVDFHNRQVVMEVATSPLSSPLSQTHNLDAIPASPRCSRSPSPGNPLDLQTPRIPKRSRSYSPATMRRPARDSILSSPSELHIHPLFRSDSPIAPPILSPGTSVIASPDAGQILPHRKSAKSLRHVKSARSGSLSSHREPLQYSKSFESTSSAPPAEVISHQERKMTPPVPEWVLNSARSPPIPRKSDERKMRPQKQDLTSE